MRLTNKNILLISPVKWDAQFVSKHHYTKELSFRNNSVYYLNPPSSIESKTTISDNICIVDYKLMMRGAHKLPPFIASFITKIEIERIEKTYNISFDIIWSFDTSRFFNLSRVNNKLKIAHLMDLSENFNRKTLCKTSDICFGVSNEIIIEMIKSNINTFKINHGLSINTNTKKGLNDIKKNKKIKIGYIGNLTLKYIDWKIIHQLAKENDELEFYFLGSETNIDDLLYNGIQFYKKTKKLSNTFFLGSKPSSIIGRYLKIFDVLLLCYKSKEYPKQLTNSHKILEYLNSGRVIVSTFTAEYQNKKHLLEMVNDSKSYSTKFTEVINNLDYYNSEIKQQERVNFALDNTYKKQLERIESLIESTCNI